MVRIDIGAYRKTLENLEELEEVNFMIEELQSDKYSYIYDEWKKGNKTASHAGDLLCRLYEIPKDMENQAKERAQNASNIYNIMMENY